MPSAQPGRGKLSKKLINPCELFISATVVAPDRAPGRVYEEQEPVPGMARPSDDPRRQMTNWEGGMKTITFFRVGLAAAAASIVILPAGAAKPARAVASAAGRPWMDTALAPAARRPSP